MIAMIHLEPLSDAFSLPLIEARLAQFPFAFRDAKKPNIYMLCGSADVMAWAQDERSKSDEFPYVGLVDLDPGHITIRQLCNEEELAVVRQFVQWLVDEYPCTIEDDDGNDWTEACVDSLDPLYA